MERVGFEDVARALDTVGGITFPKNKVLTFNSSASYYIDAGLARSYPRQLSLLARAMESLLINLPHPRPNWLAGIPEGTTPLVTALSLSTGIGQLTPKVKEFRAGGQPEIIGAGYKPGDIATICEDVITTGGSTIAGVDILEYFKLFVPSAIVLVDREEQNGRANILRRVGYFSAFCTASQLLTFYKDNQMITDQEYSQAWSHPHPIGI